MKTNKAVQVSFVLLMVAMIIGLIYGLVVTFSTELLVSRSFPLYTGQSWTDLKMSDPVLANYIIIALRFAGGGALGLSFAAIMVLFNAYRKVEKWSWYVMLGSSTIAWGITLIGNITYNNPVTIAICVVGLSLNAIALIISAKAFLVDK